MLHAKSPEEVPQPIKALLDTISFWEQDESDAIQARDELRKNYQQLISDEEQTTLFSNVGAALRRFSDAGIYLGDASPRNIVINSELRPTFVDFEKTEFHKKSLTARQRDRQVTRFVKSFGEEIVLVYAESRRSFMREYWG